jgi:hypothetical protein
MICLGNDIKRWFKILSLDELAYEIEMAVNPELELSPDLMVEIASRLGAIRRENLQEFVPNYLPPKPRFSFFSRPPISKRIVDRYGERQSLNDALKDPVVSIICIGGPGGIGKTYRTTWLASEAKHQNFNILWVECN